MNERDELYRKALESEGGMPVSAGARLFHVQNSGYYVDLSRVPADKRTALITEIQRLVRDAGGLSAMNCMTE